MSHAVEIEHVVVKWFQGCRKNNFPEYRGVGLEAVRSFLSKVLQ